VTSGNDSSHEPRHPADGDVGAKGRPLLDRLESGHFALGRVNHACSALFFLGLIVGGRGLAALHQGLGFLH
jgi:hypothetical protein